MLTVQPVFIPFRLTPWISFNIHSINLILFHTITIHFNYKVHVFALQSVCQLVVGFKTIIASILNLNTYVK